MTYAYFSNLKVNVRYRVSMSDCCVRGSFTAKVSKIVWDQEEDYIRSVWFDNGVVLTRCDMCKFEEI